MTSEKPGVGSGALVGLLLMAAALSLLYLIAGLLNLPYAPLKAFDWLARNLPGGLVTSGLELLLGLLNALGLPLSQTGKLAQGILAHVIFLTAGALGGAALFAVLRQAPAEADITPGLALGAAGASALVLMVNAVSIDPPGPAWFLLALVLLGTGMAWGGLTAWAYQRLERLR